MSHWMRPGPRIELKPELPKRGSLTTANANGSNHELPRPTPPRISTSSFTRSAGFWLMLPAASSGVVDVVTVNGDPLRRLRTLFNCQPPTMADHRPPLFSQRRPVPNGSSQMLRALNTCVRSKSDTERFKWYRSGIRTRGCWSLFDAPASPSDRDSV